MVSPEKPRIGESREEYATSYKSSGDLFHSIFNRATKLRNEIASALNEEVRIPGLETSQRAPSVVRFEAQVAARDADQMSDIDEMPLRHVLADIDDGENLDDLDDLLVVEALNSKTRGFNPHELVDDDYAFILDGIDNLDDISNLLVDSQATRTKNVQPEKNIFENGIDSGELKDQRFEEAKTIPRATENEGIMASLSQVHAARIHVERLEVNSTYTFSSKAKYKVELLFPHVSNEKIVQLSTISLPRFSSPSIKTIDRHVYSIPFDKQDVFNLHFGDLISSWFKSKLEILVVSERLKADTAFKTAPVELWRCFGSLNCKEIVSAESFLWKGRVPLWCQSINTTAFPRLNIPSQTTGRRRLQKAVLPSPTFIGDAIITIELLTFPSVAMSGINAERPLAQSSPNGYPEESDVLRLPPKTKDEAAAAPEYGIPPNYLHIKISTARALAISHSGGFPSSVLLNLVVRLVSSMLPATTTPPIPYLPPFDLETGRLNTPPNFDFAITLPLALTTSSLPNCSKFPSIIEVWASYLGTSNAERRKDTLQLDGAQLIGLVRLPINHLLETAQQNLNGNIVKPSGSDLELLDMPLMIPETDYCIVDPFSGTARGWLKCFLSLGTWKQTQKVQEDLGSFQSSDDRRSYASQGSPKRDDKLKTLEKDFLDRIAIRQGSGIKKTPKSVAASCSMLISLHAACGIRGLIQRRIQAQQYLDNSVSAGKQPAYTALDYASETGGNICISIRLFAKELTSIHSVRVKSKDSDKFVEADIYNGIVSTPIVVHSFSPSFEFTCVVVLEEIGTRFVDFIEDGGSILGEVWHKPLKTSKDDKDVLLGIFKVPLSDTLTRPCGISAAWIPIDPTLGAQSSINNIGAVRATVKFLSGVQFREFDFAGLNLTLDLTLSISSVSIPMRRSSSGTKNIDDRNFFARFVVPSQLGNKPATHETARVIGHVSGDRFIANLNFFGVFSFSDLTFVVKWFRQHNLEINIFEELMDGPNPEAPIGDVSINIYGALQLLRWKPGETTSLKGPYPLICAWCDDLKDCLADVSVAGNIRKTPISSTSQDVVPEDLVFAKVLNPKATPAKQQPLQSDALIAPLAKVAHIGTRRDHRARKENSSVFVDINLARVVDMHVDISTPQKYLFVTFAWSHSTDSHVIHRTHSVSLSSNPSWNYQVSCSLLDDELSLRALRSNRRYLKLFICTSSQKLTTLSEKRSGLADLIDPVKVNQATDNDANIEVLGVVKVDLAPLLTGITEIEGWFDLLMHDSEVESSGRMYLRISSDANIGEHLFKHASRPVLLTPESSGTSSPFQSPSELPIRQAPHVSFEEKALSMSPLTFKTSQLFDKSSLNLLTSMELPADNSKQTEFSPEEKAEASIQTPPTDKAVAVPNLIDLDDSESSPQEPKSRGEAEEKSPDADFSASLQKAIDELEALQKVLENKAKNDVKSYHSPNRYSAPSIVDNNLEPPDILKDNSLPLIQADTVLAMSDLLVEEQGDKIDARKDSVIKSVNSSEKNTDEPRKATITASSNNSTSLPEKIHSQTAPILKNTTNLNSKLDYPPKFGDAREDTTLKFNTKSDKTGTAAASPGKNELREEFYSSFSRRKEKLWPEFPEIGWAEELSAVIDETPSAKKDFTVKIELRKGRVLAR
ncbi:hypothetical protein HDU97_007299 [Phlyctochytrium planicorne]|nr:hypothetical protein HDU97_007299 [Phlyctochytrium planicorne]